MKQMMKHFVLIVLCTFSASAFAADSPLAGWIATNAPAEPTIAGIRSDHTGSTYTLRPSLSSPQYCFGFIEAPPPYITIPAPVDTRDGNIFTMRVAFNFNGAYLGTAPEVRLRVHTSDFTQFALASITPGRFAQLRSAGRGDAIVTFDRRYLTADTPMRLYIDLLGAASDVDPNFYFTAESIELLVNVSNSADTREALISASYLETDGDVYVYVNGSKDRRRIYIGANSYAVDGAYAVVLDDGKLYYFSAYDDFDQHTIESNGTVESAGISNQWVVYVEDDGDVRSFNIKTGARVKLNNNSNFFGTVGQGSGSIVVMKNRNDSGGTREVYQFDSRKSAIPILERVNGDTDARFVNTSSTGFVSSSKRSADTNASGVWTTQE
ncbi:hypothetical protein BH09SUM1_BH09SUM1_20610 [soil metagenome]